MYRVELYARVRRACMVEGMSTREAARVFGLHRDTVRKMLKYSAPPGYRRQSPPRRPKLDPYRGVIDRIIEEDRSLPKKQRHAAKRIYDRLRAEHGFDGTPAATAHRSGGRGGRPDRDAPNRGRARGGVLHFPSKPDSQREYLFQPINRDKIDDCGEKRKLSCAFRTLNFR